MSEFWDGIRADTKRLLQARDYGKGPVAERLATSGVEAGELIGASVKLGEAWIPGVEVFVRTVFSQRHRGTFSELARQEEGILGKIGLWPKQWATARMFAGSSKGLHIHPPHIPEGVPAAEWLRRLFIEEAGNFSLRPYDIEQWDLMFFLQGAAEIFLVDEREGLGRKLMRFWVEGDDHRGPNNAAVVIPPGVAHAIRAESVRDVVMVYGTTTVFHPPSEGRLASGVEIAELPQGWADYFHA